MEHVAVVDPRCPDRPLAEFDRLEVQLDPWALSRGRVVVTDGRLRGLRVSTKPASDAWLRQCRAAPDTSAHALERAWSDVMKLQPAGLESKMTSIQTIRQRSRQWGVEFDRIIGAAGKWQAAFDELDELVRQVGDNPLRMTADYRRRLEELANIGRQLDQLHNDMQTLSDRIVAEHEALQRQREADLQQLSAATELGSVDGVSLSHYLLESHWRQELSQWMGWIRTLQQLPAALPPRKRLAQSNTRGVDVLFNSSCEPGLLLKFLSVQGVAAVDGRQRQFRGTLQNFSDRPAAVEQAAVIRLTALGPAPIQMEAVLDRHGPRAKDRMRLVGAQMCTPQHVLGSPDTFAVDVAAGFRRVAMLVDIDGDQLCGRLEFLQSGAELSPRWPGIQQDASQRFHESLRDLTEVSGSIELTGTLQYPVWSVSSELGDQVASRLGDVLQQEVQTHLAELRSAGEKLVAQEFETVYDSLKQYESQAESTLAAKKQELASFLARIRDRTDLMDRLVRNAGPLENLLR